MGLLRRTSIALIFCAPFAARAASLDFQTSSGSSLSTARLAFDSRVNSRRESGLVGDASIAVTKATATFPAFGEVNDNTIGLNGSLGWKFNRSWEAGLLLNLSSTPAENLQQGGLALYGEYTHYFGGERGTAPRPKRDLRKPSSEDFPADFLAEEDGQKSAPASPTPVFFQPSLGGRISFGRTHLTDRPNAVLRALFPSLADVVDELNQKFLTLEISGQPWRWFGARLSLTGYTYDQDIHEFLAFLSDRRSLGASTFESSVNGLPKSASTLTLSFFPSDDWEIDWIGNSARSLSTGELTKCTQILAAHDFNSWLRIGFGLERDVSDELAQSLLLLNFSFAL